MIKDLFWVGLGGFLGSSIRYLINIGMTGYAWPVPWPTLIINILGSFIIGVLMGTSGPGSQPWKLFLATGFCGGFTTFSTFSYENLRLWQEGHEKIALIYMALSLIGGILSAFSGYFITQRLIA